jgi:predicted secreted Zn-dependent protease
MRVRHNDLTWRKSTRSGAAGHCVEIAETPAAILVRDSKDASGPVLRFASVDWQGFLAGVRDGEFDRPTA